MKQSPGSGTLWAILCLVTALFTLYVANSSATLVARGFNSGGGEARIVRITKALEDEQGGTYVLAAASGLLRSGVSTQKPEPYWTKLTNSRKGELAYTLNIGQLTEADQKLFQTGSVLWIQTQQASGPLTLTSGSGTFGPVSVYSTPFARIFVLVASVTWLALFAQALIPRGLYTGLLRAMIGRDNRLSNAQFQMFTWFLVFIGSYVSTMVWRLASGSPQLALGITSPESLVALTGLSAGTFVVAKAITSSAVATGEIIKPPAPEPAVSQLYSDDLNRFDFGDFQSLVVTLVAVGGYLIGLGGWQEHVYLTAQTELPDVGNTILTIFGAGQATYLLKKGLRTDAIRHFGLELSPEVLRVQPPAPGTVTLSVIAAHGVTVHPPSVRVFQQGAGVMTVGQPQVTGLVTSYPLKVNTTGLKAGAYTYEVTVSGDSAVRTVIGQFIVA